MRRSRFDPLEPSKEPRWYTVRNMHGKQLEARLMPPGSDLKRVFVAAMLEWIDAACGSGSSPRLDGTFFCTTGAERRQIDITPSDPGSAASSASRTA
jgi:hypothetical protein